MYTFIRVYSNDITTQNAGCDFRVITEHLSKGEKYGKST